MTDDVHKSAAGPQDLDALEGDIRASRARIGGTVEALRDRSSRLRDRLTRWSPQSLMENSMKHTYSPSQQSDRYESGQTVHYRQSHSSGSMLGSMTSNPIPLALVGIGLGWLALSSTGYDRRIARSSTVRNARHRMGDAVDYARESLSDATDSVRHAASSAYDSASGAVSSAYDSASGTVSGMMGGSDGDHASGRGDNRGDLHGQRQSQSYASRGMSRLSSMAPSTDHLRHRAHDMSTGFWELVEDHPIVAGAMGVALGAAIGAALPGTRYEKQWVGEYADEATERAKAIAMDALDRGTRAAQAAAETVVESAKEDVRDVVSEATNAAREEVKKPG